MRHTELWERLDRHLGVSYASVWADQIVIGDLDHRTVREALDAGVPPKQVWAAVWKVLELPASER
ncbi:MAG TPA: DUF3046 domain-containing protein [Nocardioides sp.]|nr:DUF3046 domain-containing protein [Nocardioides sp.]